MEIITLICSLIIGGFFLVANLTGPFVFKFVCKLSAIWLIVLEMSKTV